MKLVIIFYLTIFLINFYQFKKVENKIKSNQEFSDVYHSINLFYLKFETLKKNGKLENFPMINKIINKFLKNMFILQKGQNFKEIKCSRIKDVNISNPKEDEKFLKEIISSDESIKELLCGMLEISDRILYNVDKKLYIISNVKVFYEMAKFIIRTIPFVKNAINSLEEKKEYFTVMSKNRELNDLMGNHC